jgi:hypothetical protein
VGDFRPTISAAVVALCCLAVLGLGLRVYLAVVTAGTNDILTWSRFAELIHRHGVLWAYQNLPDFNHPPLMGYWAVASLKLAGMTALPFHLFLKLPGLVGEGIVTWLLYRIWRGAGAVAAIGAVAAYAWCGISILISGVHGNTDCLCAAFCLLAILLLVRGHALSSGLAMAAALNVKLLPLVLLPGLVLNLRDRRALVRFGAGLCVGAVPFLPFVLASWDHFHHNAIAYNSNQDNWGIMAFVNLSESNGALARYAARFRDEFVPRGRYVVLLVSAFVALVVRLRTPRALLALPAVTFAIFLILTPGFGVQYLVYLAPLLFAVSLRDGLLFGTLAGAFVLVIYVTFLTNARPYLTVFATKFPMPAPLFGIVVWCLLIGIVTRFCRSLWAR